jgi:hypothetical protein
MNPFVGNFEQWAKNRNVDFLSPFHSAEEDEATKTACMMLALALAHTDHAHTHEGRAIKDALSLCQSPIEKTMLLSLAIVIVTGFRTQLTFRLRSHQYEPFLKTWSGAASYVVRNYVIGPDGNSYQCIRDNTNKIPPNTLYWTDLDDELIAVVDMVPTHHFIITPQAQINDMRVDFLVELHSEEEGNELSYRCLDVEVPDPIVSRLVVECDGHDFHEKTKEQASRDKERDRFLKIGGYEVFRYAGTDIFNRPMECAQEAVNFMLTTSRRKVVFALGRRGVKPM